MFASHPRPGVAALIVRTRKPRSRINSAATALLSSLFLCIANAPAADAPENLAVTPCLHLCVKVGITPGTATNSIPRLLVQFWGSAGTPLVTVSLAPCIAWICSYGGADCTA